MYVCMYTYLHPSVKSEDKNSCAQQHPCPWKVTPYEPAAPSGDDDDDDNNNNNKTITPLGKGPGGSIPAAHGDSDCMDAAFFYYG